MFHLVKTSHVVKNSQSGLLVGFITMSWMNGISQPQGNGNRPQGEGEVSGKVLDKVSGKPVEYANILILRERDSVMVYGWDNQYSRGLPHYQCSVWPVQVVANFIGFEKTTVPGIMVNPKSTQLLCRTFCYSLLPLACREQKLLQKGPLMIFRLIRK